MIRRFSAVLFSSTLVVLGACEQVQSPQITAEQVTIGKITPQGASIEAQLTVYNPNKGALTANGLTTTVTIGGKPNVARASVAEPLVLPAGQKTQVKLPIRVDWTDPAAISALAEAKQSAPYAVTGSVSFSGGKDVVQTPVQINGTMTAAELAQAAGTAPKPAASKP